MAFPEQVVQHVGHFGPPRSGLALSEKPWERLVQGFERWQRLEFPDRGYDASQMIMNPVIPCTHGQHPAKP